MDGDIVMKVVVEGVGVEEEDENIVMKVVVEGVEVGVGEEVEDTQMALVEVMYYSLLPWCPTESGASYQNVTLPHLTKK